MIGSGSACFIDQTIGAVHEPEARPILGEERHLAFELRRLPDIVCVEKGDEGCLAGRKAQIAGVRDAAGLASDDLQTWPAPLILRQDLRRQIGRSIVDNDDRPGRMCLRCYAIETSRQEPSAVSDRDHDIDIEPLNAAVHRRRTLRGIRSRDFRSRRYGTEMSFDARFELLKSKGDLLRSISRLTSPQMPGARTLRSAAIGRGRWHRDRIRAVDA